MLAFNLKITLRLDKLWIVQWHNINHNKLKM